MKRLRTGSLAGVGCLLLAMSGVAWAQPAASPADEAKGAVTEATKKAKGAVTTPAEKAKGAVGAQPEVVRGRDLMTEE